MKYFKFRYLLLPPAGIAILTFIWFSYVGTVSRVNGDHPVYLQMGGPDRMTIRWGTKEPAKGEVYYGISPASLSHHAEESEALANHRVSLTGLEPNRKYFYRIQQDGLWLQDHAAWFKTSPVPGGSKETRIWLLGDPGKSAQKIPVRDQALKWLSDHPRKNQPDLDLILTTGDQAYPDCSYDEYVREFLNPFQQVFKNIPVWPVFGNHDARRNTFYQLFDRPANAELGGLASGTVNYFSFDYAQTHIVMLDTHDMSLSPGSAMLDWLMHDLVLNRKKWTIALFHYPPYTRGTYDSDKSYSRKQRIRLTRENVLPVLEIGGVDLVVAGHSHVYERSKFMRGHYGKSDSFSQSMLTGVEKKISNGSMVYMENPKQEKPGTATMYMVLGSSGEGNKGRFDHPALPVHSDKAGSVILDIDKDYLHSRYITADGQVLDEFSIVKPDQTAKLTNG